MMLYIKLLQGVDHRIKFKVGHYNLNLKPSTLRIDLIGDLLTRIRLDCKMLPNMEAIKTGVEAVATFIWNTPKVLPFMVVLLLFTGIFLTIRMGFVQFRKLGHSIKIILGKYDNPEDHGDVSHFQALSSALSATVGIGNIAGVATAVHYGGPGAVFWLWLTGFVGMATKFTECTLAQKYRVIHEDGSVSGGPMYYIEKGLGPNWKWLAMTFAAAAAISSFGSGNSIQAFTMADSFRSDFGIPNWISGLVSASIVGMVILGGIKRIGAVASKLVPFMGGLYVTAGLIIVLLNIDKLGSAVNQIVTYAFSPPGMIGGFAGSGFVFTLTWGVKRGLFSNEAGQGSAPIAHAAARTDEPVREGAVALLEPFIDTVLICFMTGLIIVVTGVWNKKLPDKVTFTAKNSITVVKKHTHVLTNGKIADKDLFEGTVHVKDGYILNASLVRNNSIVDDARLFFNKRPFNGIIKVSKGHTHFFTSQGQSIKNSSIILKGKNLYNGSPLTAAAFEKGLAPITSGGSHLVTIAVFLFAISTAISWSYYGERSVLYLFGPKAILPYRLIYITAHFLGAIFSLELVWAFGDAALGIMALPNLFAILALSKVVQRDAKDYFERMKALEGK